MEVFSVKCRFALGFFLVLFWSLSAARAQEQPPTYSVKRATSGISIDGEMKDDAWAVAPAITLQFPWEHQTGAKQKTEVRLLWNDDYLFALFTCRDDDVIAIYTNRDDPTYRDDAVEIFLNPRPSQETTYYGLEMNAGAVLYDYVAVMPNVFYKRFQMNGVQLAVSIRGTRNVRGNMDDGWKLEVAIPWENFETLGSRPKAGDRWRAQLNRWDGTSPDRRLSMWVDPKVKDPTPHVPSRFGWLEFAD